MPDLGASAKKWFEHSNRLTSSVPTDNLKNLVSNLLAALKECSAKKDLNRGKQLHSQAAQAGNFCNRYVCNSLINMYAKCSRINQAQNVFDSMLSPNVVSWNSLLQGYVENGESELALKLFHEMKQGCQPDARTFLVALNACGALAAGRDRGEAWRWLEQGKMIHSQAAGSKCCDIFVESSLVCLYSRCGSMKLARSVFDEMQSRDIVCWNALLQGYADNGESETVMSLFRDLERDNQGGCSPNPRTYLAALTACCSLIGSDRVSGKCMEKSLWFAEAKGIFSRAVKRGCCDMFVENVAIDMYVKAGCMAEARDVFDRMARKDVISWNVLLHGYVENGENLTALELFDSMEARRCAPDARSFVAALAACAAMCEKERRNSPAALNWLEQAETIFLSAKARSCADRFVETAMLNVHAKCGRIDGAQRLFDSMEQQNVVSWTCLVQGYVEDEQHELALRTIAEMDLSGVAPASATFVAALMACGSLQAIERGLEFHGESVIRGFDKDVLVATALVDFLGKCGNMEAASDAFESISLKDLWAWNTLMCGYSQQGNSSAVLDAFERMKKQGLSPNRVTFTQLLTVCSHAGLTEKGQELFYEMEPKYGIAPDLMHYNCVVDLLARANKLDEALKVVRRMPFEPNAITWTSILGACRKWNNAAVGKVAYDALLKLDEKDAGAYLLMSNIYGSKTLG